MPKKAGKALKAALQTHSLAKLQQDLLLERSKMFYAGVDGAFNIHDLTTRQPVHELSDLQNCHQYRVEWMSQREGAEGGGQNEFLFLSAASLALEMHALTLGDADEHFKYLEGGILYLEGEPHLFWSMMIHLKMTGACIPFERRADSKWEETWCIQEMEKMMFPLMAGGSGSSRTPLKMASRSLALISFMQRRKSGNLFGVSLDELYIPTDPSLLPAWWGASNLLWTSMLERAAEAGAGRGRVPCMFYCTPRGCEAGESSCLGYHDGEFKSKIDQIKLTSPNY